MDWRIHLLLFGELGLFVFTLWLPWRMARAGIRNPWPMLAGWLVLTGLTFALVALSMLGVAGDRGADETLLNAMPEGPDILAALFFGWVYVSLAAYAGRKGNLKFLFVKSPNILDEIVEQKKREVALLPERRLAAGDLRDALLEHGERRDFLAALRHPRIGDIGLIAEVKKASPSAGVICPNFDPVRIATEYQAAGASCLSVLTDEKYFQGSLDYLRSIRAAVTLPLLRKDFIIDERQILEAIEWGADAILLIVAILDDERLRRFHDLAIGAGLAVLVEVHDEAELDRALAFGAELIGVNNRNLKTFKVDLGTTTRLAEKLVGHFLQERGIRETTRSSEQ